MHILQCHSVRDIIHSLARPIITEPFGIHKSINLFLGSKTKTADVRLGEDYTKQTIVEYIEALSLATVGSPSL